MRPYKKSRRWNVDKRRWWSNSKPKNWQGLCNLEPGVCHNQIYNWLVVSKRFYMVLFATISGMTGMIPTDLWIPLVFSMVFSSRLKASNRFVKRGTKGKVPNSAGVNLEVPGTPVPTQEPCLG